MTSALQKAIAVVGELPVEDQDMIADVMMRLARIDDELVEIDPDHLEDVRAGVEEARRGEFATAEEIEEAFAAFRK